MKKITAMLLALAMILSLPAVAVFAEITVSGEDEIPILTPEPKTDGACFGDAEITMIDRTPKKKLFASKTLLQSEPKDIKTYLLEELKAHKEVIPVYDFDTGEGYIISQKDFAQAVFNVCLDNYDILVRIDVSLVMTGYTYGDETYICSYRPLYVFDSYEEDAAAVKEMDDVIDEYLDAAEPVPDLVGKLLIIHDKFCEENYYSFKKLATGENNEKMLKNIILTGLSPFLRFLQAWNASKGQFC